MRIQFAASHISSVRAVYWLQQVHVKLPKVVLRVTESFSERINTPLKKDNQYIVIAMVVTSVAVRPFPITILLLFAYGFWEDVKAIVAALPNNLVNREPEWEPESPNLAIDPLEMWNGTQNPVSRDKRRKL
ncbi:hypothetical protein VNO77_20305 [Canavalia gladiata]|uniref:Uncharacterized protein n=1 Tax=Canavalia gladiata TaxID=3824 RepID=A0AAN9LP69_CANGL